MLPSYFLFIGAFIQIGGSFSYFLDTLKGKTQPNRVTWLLWAIVPAIVGFGQLDQGVAGLTTVFTFVICGYPTAIFLATFFNKKAVWKLGPFDYICGALSILAVVLWWLTKNGNYAIVFGILADLFAGIPTIKKSYTHPKSENSKDYLASIIYSIILLLTLTNWNFADWSFAMYCLLLNITLFYLIVIQPRFAKIRS